MEITITTPALLFPAVSFFFLAYNHRYLAVAKRIRELHSLYNKTKSQYAQKQVVSLRKRIRLIVLMQLFAVLGIISSVLTMAIIFFGSQPMAKYFFLLGMLLIVLSLLASLWELLISTRALNIELQRIEGD